MRTMLVCIGIFAIWFGWISHTARQQRKAVEWIRSHGGEVWYEDEFGIDSIGYVAELDPNERPAERIPLPREWKASVLRDYEWRVVAAAVHVGSDASLIAPLHDLEYLSLYRTDISDLRPIAGLTKLKRLELEQTEVEDISTLRHFTHLARLNLTNTRVRDLPPLSGLSDLEQLELDRTEVTDLSALKGLTKLSQLDLSHTNIAVFDSLHGLHNLSTIDVTNTNATPHQIEALQEALPSCDVFEWGKGRSNDE